MLRLSISVGLLRRAEVRSLLALLLLRDARRDAQVDAADRLVADDPLARYNLLSRYRLRPAAALTCSDGCTATLRRSLRTHRPSPEHQCLTCRLT